MKMFKRSLALMFAVLLCCMTVFAVSANGEDNDVVDDWDGPVEEEALVGDVDGVDGVTNSDVVIIRKYIAGLLTESEIADYNFTVADVDGVDNVTNSDVVIIRKFIAGLLTESEIAEYGFTVA